MIAVIGDVHGCYYTLLELFNKIKDKYPELEIFCVGDLVDRGNYSCQVINFVMEKKVKVTTGNHDQMFYYFFKHPFNEIGKAWLYNGYEQTLISYSNNNYHKLEEHLNFIKSAPLYYNLDDCFISHAGISKYYKKVLQENNNDLNAIDSVLKSDFEADHGILWTRNELLDIGKLQIVGHTRKKEILSIKNTNVVYIDTSAYTNKLSAVIVEDNKIIETISIQTLYEDIN